MEIPNDRRLIAQLDVICRRVAVECRHRLPKKLLCFLVVAPLIIEQACRENENPVGELLLQPVKSLGVSSLKRHIHSGRLADILFYFRVSFSVVCKSQYIIRRNIIKACELN